MAQGLLDLLWRRLFSPGVKDSGLKSITYFDLQLQYKKFKELSSLTISLRILLFRNRDKFYFIILHKDMYETPK